MIGKKLHTLLATFSKVEWAEFESFLQSPFFNENGDLLRLFEYLDRQFGRQNALPDKTAFTREKVWQAIFGNQAYEDVVLRRLTSDLTQLAYRYLAQKEANSGELAAATHLLSALNRPGLNKHFNGVVRQLAPQAERKEARHAHFHRHLFQLAQFRHRHEEQSGKKLKSLQFLEQADYHLDCYYLIQKLKNYCDALGYRSTLSAEARLDLPPALMDYIPQAPFFSEPGVRAYYWAARMMLEPEEEDHFQHLKRMLDEEAEGFEMADLQVLFIHLMNYCIDTKINMGRPEYFQELFSLYQTSLDKEIIIEQGALDPHHYKNIITVGLHIREFDWVEMFIQEYTSRLPVSNQENALTYNLAQVYFHQQQYEKVIEQLREVEYQNLVYALGAKLMLLKTYYELKEFLALDSLIDSFRIYLRRNKLISADVKQQYLNVLRFVRKLSSVPPYNRNAINRIREQIDRCKALADKKWILEKLEEM